MKKGCGGFGVIVTLVLCMLILEQVVLVPIVMVTMRHCPIAPTTLDAGVTGNVRHSVQDMTAQLPGPSKEPWFQGRSMQSSAPTAKQAAHIHVQPPSLMIVVPLTIFECLKRQNRDFTSARYQEIEAEPGKQVH